VSYFYLPPLMDTVCRQAQSLDGTTRGAIYSACQTYRYLLWISWDPSRLLCAFVMLNPSTATEKENDPTISRCERRARAWGWGGLIVANLFAFRSTDPVALYLHDEPVGPQNDACILAAAEAAETTICAWGKHGDFRGRAAHVRQLLASKPLSALKLNGDGSPAHPLYLPYSLNPVSFLPEVAR
jgi:hypothetical protein